MGSHEPSKVIIFSWQILLCRYQQKKILLSEEFLREGMSRGVSDVQEKGNQKTACLSNIISRVPFGMRVFDNNSF